MKYRIGQVARILGVSTDLLRYYERRGVVSPEKDAGNDYRYYDAWDINFLTDCLWFKSFGFSVEQTAAMLHRSDAAGLRADFLENEERIKGDIRRSSLLLRRSEEHRADLEKTESLLYKCELCRSPELIRFINRAGDEYSLGASSREQAAIWLKALPFNRRYFEMRGEADLPGRESDYFWGYAITSDYAGELGLVPAPPMVTVPSRMCIHTVFKNSEGRGGFSPSLLQYALDFAAARGVGVFGPVFGVLLASVMENGRLTGYFEAWLPIE